MPAILVVDDSATLRKMIMAALRPLDPVFFEASTGLEALEQLALRAYDLVTLDLNMPDMHGLEFLHFVRSHTLFKAVPVIVITTRTGEGIREQVLSAGADHFLTKPFTQNELLDAARRVLQPGEVH